MSGKMYKHSNGKVKWVTFILALFPLWASYRSIVARVDFGTFIILATAVFYIIQDHFKLRIYDPKRSAIYVYVVVVSTVCIFSIHEVGDYLYTSEIQSFARLFKFVLVLFVVFRTQIFQYFDIDLGMKYTRYCIYINSIMIAVQQFAYKFGMMIYNPFEFLYQEESYIGRIVQIGSFIRPAGFFFEPSHYAEFFIVFLCYILFCDDKNSIKKWDYMMLFMGAVLSGSTIGIGEIIGLSILCGFVKFKKKEKMAVIYLVFIFIFMLLSTRLSIVQLLIDRLLSGGLGYGGNIIKARIGNGFEIFKCLPVFNILFGTGYGHTPLGGSKAYLNGVTYIINTLGLIGTTIFTIVYIKMFKHCLRWQRMLLISFGILMAGAQMFTTAAIVQVFVFTAKNSEVEKRKYDKRTYDRLGYSKL